MRHNHKSIAPAALKSIEGPLTVTLAFRAKFRSFRCTTVVRDPGILVSPCKTLQDACRRRHLFSQRVSLGLRVLGFRV